jgi:hypothetical protein
MVEGKTTSSKFEGSFYSDENYGFHKYAEDYPLMNQQELIELGENIEKNSQKEDIELLGNEILDGRNRYLACRLKGITPRYRYYNDELSPLDFVLVKNYYRRHLTTIQKARIVERYLKVERRRAKERKNRTQLDGRTKDNKPRLKSSVIPSEGHTEQSPEKGPATKIVAKKLRISHNSVAKIEKINKITKTNPFIKKYWEEAQRDALPLEEAYQVIMQAKKIHESKKGVSYKNLSMYEELYEASKTDTVIKELLLKVKTRNLSLQDAHKQMIQIRKLKKNIKKNITESLRATNDRIGKKQKSIDSPKPQQQDITKKKTSLNKMYICKRCSKATLVPLPFKIKCVKFRGEICELYGVLCDDDYEDFEIVSPKDWIVLFEKLRDPNAYLCKNSPEYDLILRKTNL